MRRWMPGLLLPLTLWLGVACSLNPQPLPPGDTEEGGGGGGGTTTGYDATAGSPSPGSDAGGLFGADGASAADGTSPAEPPVDGAADAPGDAASDGQGDGAATSDGGTED